MQINQFSWQTPTAGRIFNPKFVLMCSTATLCSPGGKDKGSALYWPAIQEHSLLLKYDKQGDGLPENEGYPDQTYDTWVVRGESAYSAQSVAQRRCVPLRNCKQLGDSAAATRYHDLFQQRTSKLHQEKSGMANIPLRHRKRISRDIQADQTGGAVVRQHDPASVNLFPATCRSVSLKKNLCLTTS